MYIFFALGNYGKAFAYAAKKLGLGNCTVAMPDTAPTNRKELIKSHGVNVESVPSANLSEHVKQVWPVLILSLRTSNIHIYIYMHAHLTQIYIVMFCMRKMEPFFYTHLMILI